MGRKATKIAVSQLTDISISTIMDKYTELIRENEAKSAPYRAVLHHKVLFLIHLIITRCRASKDNKIQLNTDRLQDVLGNEYNYILTTLKEMGIIDIDNHYLVGVQCRFISLKNWNIKVEVLPNLKVMEYLDKWNKLSQKAKNTPSIDIKIEIVDGEVQITKVNQQPLSQEEMDFRTKYEESLSCLRLKVEKSEAQEFIDTLFSNFNNHSYHYYSSYIQDFDISNLKIFNIDNQGRIYHILTSLPKKLKPLFNIKFQVDIANSHPLLFSKVLINNYKIDIETLKIIYNIKKEEYIRNLHNVTELFCNKLRISDLCVPVDVLKYIYVCSKGMIWDDFASIFKEYTRDEVKVKAFKEIFYPKQDFTEHTEFGMKFIELYPNVYQAIKEIKNATKLPNLMMRFESRLMRLILNECYAHGWKVISIHDAIVVFDVEANSTVKPIDIKIIINNIYRRYLLHPTIHLDLFDNN
ncbi:hypothetical protein [Parabacteroides merdae]|uniref:hypothetical protein n=1 Tax=Parabacteroides merdae TaxID=46503 RepID=UPI003F9D59D8